MLKQSVGRPYLTPLGTSRTMSDVFGDFMISLMKSVLPHRVLCQIPTEAENTHQKFLHIRMPLDMGENLAPILGRSPSATHTKKFQKTEN